MTDAQFNEFMSEVRWQRGIVTSMLGALENIDLNLAKLEKRDQNRGIKPRAERENEDEDNG